MSESGREQEILFAQTLESVRRCAKDQGGMIAEADVRQAFSAQKLSESQMEMIFDYLKKNKIGIGEPVDLEEYLTTEDKDYLELYFQELQGLQERSMGEKEAAALRAMAGEKQAKAELIEIYLPEVAEVAKLYAGQGVFVEDLIGEGNVALTAGVEMLGCLENPQEVPGMLLKMAMDAMEELIAENLESREADRAVLERINFIHERSQELAESLLRKITPLELSQETGIALEEIEEAVRISGGMDYIEGNAE